MGEERVQQGQRRLRVVVLISGRGSNLAAIMDAIDRQTLPVDIEAVISNRREAPGLDLAANAGIPAHVLDHRRYGDREAFDKALAELIERYRPDLVVLAGFMRILTGAFVQRFAGRLINIHPSLLPRLRGLDTHARAIAEGCREHGASVHFVTEELDGGPVILQARVPVLPDDTPEALAARVLEQEHRIYPEALRMIAEGRVHLREGRVEIEPAS